jgi:hypothetical protein
MSDDGGTVSLRWAWLIPAAGLVTLALGLWGWLDHRLALDDALYRSLALFEIDSDVYAQGVGITDWRFRLGRWTGAVAIVTSLFALMALMRARLAAALARRGRQQVVVAGSGELALAAFEAARSAGKSALWLGARAFAAPRLSTIALPWPAGERARALLDHARRADHVLIAEVDDAQAMSLARGARRAAPSAGITVVMRDAALAEAAAATLNESRTRVLSAPVLTARRLVLAHPPFLIAHDAGQARIHALIVGFGQTGQAIARELIVNCRTTFLAPPRIALIDPDAAALEAAFKVYAPELDRCADVDFIAGEVAGRAMRPSPEELARRIAAGGLLTAAYVCLPNGAAALSAAAMLGAFFRSEDVASPPIFVQLAEGAAIEGARAGQGLAAFTPFGETVALLEATEYLSRAPDAAPRAFAEAYRASLPAERRDDPDDPSAQAWERLDESYREANRDAAAHIPAKLASAGVDAALWRGLVTLPRLPPGQRLFASDAELEALADLEHERWCAQRRMEGWRSANGGPRDEARRLHPALRPYPELPDELKQYDRLMVRQTEVACSTSR